jgi:NAD(P)-dependent dehydrogenase (short-subunit alcohol dehydrogenase family)
MQLQGVSAIVSGGASGFGEATVRALAGRGARVVVLDQQDARGRRLAEEVAGTYVRADPTDGPQVNEAVHAATQLGPLRALVNCAAIGWSERTVGPGAAPAGLDGLAKVLEINVVGTFNCIRLVAAAMSGNEPLEEGERGAIVNTASTAAFEGQVGQVAYAASKAAVVGMTLPIARDLAELGIRVNTIAPGLVESPLASLAADATAARRKAVPFPPRLARPADYASLALELLTNGYLNGETVRLDGAARLPPR